MTKVMTGMPKAYNTAATPEALKDLMDNSRTFY